MNQPGMIYHWMNRSGWFKESTNGLSQFEITHHIDFAKPTKHKKINKITMCHHPVTKIHYRIQYSFFMLESMYAGCRCDVEGLLSGNGGTER